MPAIDIIGDVHGELHALRALADELGYVEWRHPAGRIPVFLGDLVDRGAHSLEVATLVMRLVRERRALCIMGNHEYNLVAWDLGVPGYEQPKSSNARTIAHVTSNRPAWTDVLAFFRTLPLALDLPDLRIIHACWHTASLAAVRDPLRPPATVAADPVGALEQHIVLASPFDGHRLRAGLPQDLSDTEEDLPHEILMKGFEVAAPRPFQDNDGHTRDRIRAVWWRDDRDQVLTDKPQVFGHYWNLPPIEGDFAPPHPSGHPELRAWGERLAARCPERGRVPLDGDYACVDFNGLTRASTTCACVGALRWPEREIVWATGPK